ncbi:MAG: hypothetical protein C9356_13080 [Oleiphilus sp.]|nr:MAG: hypothetical protein C9356_13080 [Oleiphilus sp.]
MKTQVKLLSRYMPSAKAGRVEWIGLRTARKAEMAVVERTEAIKNRGLSGDHRAARDNDSARQVTLINLEDIKALQHILDSDVIDPSVLRRNIVVSGINLHAMRYQLLRIGGAVLEIGAHCHPCQRMEKALGAGGFVSMYGRGGYCARVIQAGPVALGDEVLCLPNPD